LIDGRPERHRRVLFALDLLFLVALILKQDAQQPYVTEQIVVDAGMLLPAESSLE
jgi:hypothetical protein